MFPLHCISLKFRAHACFAHSAITIAKIRAYSPSSLSVFLTINDDQVLNLEIVVFPGYEEVQVLWVGFQFKLFSPLLCSDIAFLKVDKPLGDFSQGFVAAHGWVVGQCLGQALGDSLHLFHHKVHGTLSGV